MRRLPIDIMLTVMRNGFMCRVYDYGNGSSDIRDAWYFKTMSEACEWLKKSAIKEIDLRHEEFEKARNKK